MKTFILTEHGSRVLKGRGFNLRCERCGEPLEIGDECVSQRRAKTYSLRYHRDCWERMFVEV